MSLQTALFFLPGFIIGLTIHEAAHAISSKWLGDRLAEKQGRITLNPFKHLSPLGTVVLFWLGFGWGNPVPVNLYNFKNPKRDYLLTSLAGPLSNLLLCVIALAMLYLTNWIAKPFYDPAIRWMAWSYYCLRFLCVSTLYINMILAVVNLIPIPPLDGSKIWPCLIPGMRPTYSGKIMWMWIVVLIVMMKTGGVKRIINPAIDLMHTLVPGALQKQVVRPETFPENLVAPDDAAVYEYEIIKSPKSFHLYFKQQETCPPKLLIQWAHEYTKTQGFQPYGETSEAWIPEQEGDWFGLAWGNYWINDRQDILGIKIEYYHDPNEPEVEETAWGTMSLYMSEQAEE